MEYFDEFHLFVIKTRTNQNLRLKEKICSRRQFVTYIYYTFPISKIIYEQ